MATIEDDNTHTSFKKKMNLSPRILVYTELTIKEKCVITLTFL